MQKHEQWDQFQSKRTRLTKFWFILLAFNIFLQIDAVEEFFDGTADTSQVVVSELACSTQSQIRATSNPENQLIAFLGFSMGLSSSHSKGSFAATSVSSYKNLPLTMDHGMGFFLLFSGIPDASLVSGLSPPQLA